MAAPPSPHCDAQSPDAPKLYEYVLRKKYRDPTKLKQSLDGMFGEGTYEVNVLLRKERWILYLPVPITEAQLESLDRDVNRPYDGEADDPVEQEKLSLRSLATLPKARSEISSTDSSESHPFSDQSEVASKLPDSTMATSLTAPSEQLYARESMKPPLSDAMDDGAWSVASHSDDIGSQISIETSSQAITGKALLGLFLVQEEATKELLQEAATRMNKERLVQNLRRLLKSFHKSLLIEADTETKRSTARLLRSRRGRLRISGLIVDRLQQDNEDESKVDNAGLKVSRNDKMSVEQWLAKLDQGSRPQLGDEHQISHNEPGSESESDLELDFPQVANYEAYLRESNAMKGLQRDLMLMFLPSEVQSVLSTIPNKNIWISRDQDLSTGNRAKAWVEDKTRLRWNWWPLAPRKRLLLPNEARIGWKCSCGANLWIEISNEYCRWVERSILLPSRASSETPLCAVPRTTLGPSAYIRKIVQTFTLGNASTPSSFASQRYTPTAVTTGSSAPVTTVGKGNQLEDASGVLSNKQNQVSKDQTSNEALHSRAQERRWVLFGVDGARRTTFPAQIFIDQWTTDYHFFKDLKEVYWKQRGWLRSWFSIWRLSCCEAVKFTRLGPEFMAREYLDLPDRKEYEYTPRVPNAKNPPVSEHHFEILFYSCDVSCDRKLPHNCSHPPTGTTALPKIPKRDRSFANDLTEEIWGLGTVHDPSIAYLAAYHCLILVGPFLFFILWLKMHPDDLQNASIPASVVLTFLSLFWCSSGIFTHRKVS